MNILGIETTCDETAVAVVADGRRVLSSKVASQIELHARFGGVVPEIASRAHLEALNPLVDQALREANITDPAQQLAAVSVSHAPGLIGCLLVGVSAAKALSFAWQIPLVGVNHVQAHLYSVLLQDPADAGPDKAQDFALPAVGLVISGGHSALYHARAFDQLERIGTTHDDAVGEAFDKVASILQLGYPGGPLIDQLAQRGDPLAVKFPRSLLEKDSLDFSFSGLKTSVLYHVNGRQGRERDASSLSEQQKADIAASFQHSVAETLAEKLRRAVEQTSARCIIVGGGVSANSALRRRFEQLSHELAVPLLVPPLKYCTDNAAMIAGLAYPLLQAGKTSTLALEAIATV
jgi:N6-L-threonylcarbamoyladenine synthase